MILSSIIFSLGHGYEGTAGVVTVGFMGLFFALVYLSRKSLVAPIVLHFLQDFTGIVLIPLLIKTEYLAKKLLWVAFSEASACHHLGRFPFSEGRINCTRRIRGLVAALLFRQAL